MFYFFILFLIIWHVNKGLGRKARETSSRLFSLLLQSSYSLHKSFLLWDDTEQDYIRETMEAKPS